MCGVVSSAWKTEQQDFPRMPFEFFSPPTKDLRVVLWLQREWMWNQGDGRWWVDTVLNLQTFPALCSTASARPTWQLQHTATGFFLSCKTLLVVVEGCRDLYSMAIYPSGSHAAPSLRTAPLTFIKVLIPHQQCLRMKLLERRADLLYS